MFAPQFEYVYVFAYDVFVKNGVKRKCDVKKNK